MDFSGETCPVKIQVPFLPKMSLIALLDQQFIESSVPQEQQGKSTWCHRELNPGPLCGKPML